MIGEIFTALLPYAAPIVMGGAAMLKSIAFVQEGERGLILRFGRVIRKKGEPKVTEPGFVLMVPWVDKLRRRHVRQQTLTFHEQLITLKNGLSYRINAVVFFKVKDIYKALFEIADLDDAVRNVAMGILRDIITAFPDQHSFADMEKINAQLLEKIKTHADDWGAEFAEFRLTDCSPTEEASAIVSAEAGAIARVNALKAALKSVDLDFADVNQALAAVLVGIPVAATIGHESTTHHTTLVSTPKKSNGIFSRSSEDHEAA